MFGIKNEIYLKTSEEVGPLIINIGTDEPPKKKIKNKYSQIIAVYAFSFLTNVAANKASEIPKTIEKIKDKNT